MAQGLFNLKQVNQAIQQGGWSAQKPPQVEYLVVAGGGSGAGGAGYAGGGGGAGGFLAGMGSVPNGQSILVTVGAGGTASAGQTNGTSGDNSVFGRIIATGGGYGSYGQGSAAASGGSGGGSGSNGGRYGQAVLGQGNIGGLGYGTTSGCAGGGGGAGAVGAPVGVYTNYAGNGGVGAASAITGTVTTYAGGGGGSANNTNTGGAGGFGGGGAGASGTSTNAVAGTANTGGGGGGAGNQSGGTRIGGNGGSGIVVISYPDTYAAAASTTGSPTVSTSGSGSLSFDGSSQYLTYASNAAWALGSTFTLEFWTYPTAFSSGSNKRFFDTSNNGSGGFSLRTTGTGVVALDVTATGQTNTTLSLNTWTHVAVVVTSGVLTIYFNGVSQSLTGTTTGINVTGTLGLTVANFGTASTYAYQGYMTNIRIVKGVAVYTGNFTPSTVPLQATQPAGTNIAAITGTSTGLLLTSVSGSSCADISTNGFGATSSPTIAPSWNTLSPFTVAGYKNRVYTWTSSGSITF